LLQHEAEKAAQEAAIEKRRAEEKARLDAIGMDHENNFNIALCGVSGAQGLKQFSRVSLLLSFSRLVCLRAGSGKSTLNNALRKVRRGEPGYANTKAGAECTTVSAKYAHPQVPYLMLWDVPGGGTDAHPAATYFSDKCLDLFDLLVLCYDGRWSAVNTQIVKEAARTGTNIVILYTKADNHVENMVREDDSLTRLEAFAQLKRTVEVDVAAKLAACGVVTLKMPVMLVDCYGIRDNRYEFDEIAFVRAIVTSTAFRLNKSPDEVWGMFGDARTAEGGVQ
jgi:predicted GTPase